MSNTEIIHTIQGLRLLLETLEAQLAGGKAAPVSKAPAAEKPKRVASDALKAWNAEVDKVKAEMIADGWTHPETGKPVTRKDAMQEASRRRAADPDAPKPKPKPKPKAAAESTSDAEEKPKPKRVLSDEQKAKMAAGRKAAAERRKAEKAAEAAATAAPEPKKVSFAHPPLPPSDDEEQEEEEEHLTPIAVKARKYLMNPEHGTCWKRNADGTKGEYAGVYDAESKTIDDSIPEEFFE